LSVYPNPFNNKIIITLDLSEYSNINISIYDILGQTILTKALGNLSAGRVEQAIQMPDGISAGLYFVTLNINGKDYSNKIIKE